MTEKKPHLKSGAKRVKTVLQGVQAIEHKKEECSEEFQRAISTMGSYCILCEHCGRVHFVDAPLVIDWEKGELEELREQEAKNPDRYLGRTDCGSIPWGHVNGKQLVADCPCNSGRKFEDLFWSHRFLIADYFQNKITSMKKVLKHNEGAVDTITSAIKDTL